MKDQDINELIDQNIVIELEDQKPDLKIKNWFRFKIIIAEILNKTIPLFMDMTVKDIVKNCLDPVNP